MVFVEFSENIIYIWFCQKHFLSAKCSDRLYVCMDVLCKKIKRILVFIILLLTTAVWYVWSTYHTATLVRPRKSTGPFVLQIFYPCSRKSLLQKSDISQTSTFGKKVHIVCWKNPFSILKYSGQRNLSPTVLSRIKRSGILQQSHNKCTACTLGTKSLCHCCRKLQLQIIILGKKS